jgi:hypothetical protein
VESHKAEGERQDTQEHTTGGSFHMKFKNRQK